MEARNQYDDLLILTIHFLSEHDTYGEISINELLDFVDKIQNYVRKKYEVKK
jgi:hypothetical protein